MLVAICQLGALFPHILGFGVFFPLPGGVLNDLNTILALQKLVLDVHPFLQLQLFAPNLM
jgi:hypothetical protein